VTGAPIVTVGLRSDEDIVLARQRSRAIAAAVGLDVQEQTRLSTALSELLRNARQYAGEGRVTFTLADDDGARYLLAQVADRGPGIADIEAVLSGITGGAGIVNARRLADRFSIESSPGGGTVVTIGKVVPSGRALDELVQLAVVALSATKARPAGDELGQQNRELAHALALVEEYRQELERVNAELEETNRGVVALYAELDDRAMDLKRASESKSRFLSMISHELRTPLTSVLNLSRLLLDRVDGDLTGEQERQITLIRNSVASLTEMVNDLLDLAKIEAGKTTLRLGRISVNELIAGLRGVFRPVLSSTQVALIFEDVDPALTLCSDEGKVAQVVRNFISNAVKFTERGEIRVSVASRDGDMLRFSVRDTGIGIAPEDIGRIFEEFGQVESARQRHVKGTGLGLSLARTIAELLGGKVGVESEPGIGSHFWLEIPRIDPRSLPGCEETTIELGGMGTPARGLPHG
jgi:signal transduction histidine kinase